MVAMCAAKEAGILLSYDPNVRFLLWPSEDAARDGIKSIWKEANFIKVSGDEVAFLTKGNPTMEDVVLSLWFDGLKLLVATDGEKGQCGDSGHWKRDCPKRLAMKQTGISGKQAA